jgi:hypothetical protein
MNFGTLYRDAQFSLSRNKMIVSSLCRCSEFTAFAVDARPGKFKKYPKRTCTPQPCFATVTFHVLQNTAHVSEWCLARWAFEVEVRIRRLIPLCLVALES